jgi:DNA-binding NarL/FixJ family response regulator
VDETSSLTPSTRYILMAPAPCITGGGFYSTAKKMASKRKWTADEEQGLVAMAKNGHGRSVIAKALDRSITSVQQKAFWLNISVAEQAASQDRAKGEEMRHRAMPWTSEEEEILRQGAIDGGLIDDIARKIGRSETAIRSHARVLRVSLARSKLKRRLK